MKLNKFSIFIIALICTVGCYIAISRYLAHRNLISEPIYAKITKVEYKSRGGYFYFYGEKSFDSGSYRMERKVKHLNVGDSVSKAKNDVILYTYKKDQNGIYKFHEKFEGYWNWW